MNEELLLKKIDDSNLSRSTIAEHLGITRQCLYNKLRGEREFKGSEIKNLSTLLDLSEQERTLIFFADVVGENANTKKGNM